MTHRTNRVTLSQLLPRFERIEIPLIQRDYAQGRDTEKDIRDDFLKALYNSLLMAPEDPRLPLNLDFIYGNMERLDGKLFLPLDGQQRLTTLFLLHWYAAWQDRLHSDFEHLFWDGKHSRFTYRVRPSSAEFFDELVRFRPSVTSDSVPSIGRLLEDQPWFFLYWRLDPTIQSVLTMLDAIHSCFGAANGLFQRLVDEAHPAITFEILPLEHFGLTDDLYIKMNARGKPLTPFETFKARFEEHLAEVFPAKTRMLADNIVSVADFFGRRIDTQWTDLFWAYKDNRDNTFDEAAMNLFLTLARVSLDPESPSFSEDYTLFVRLGGNGTFSQLHERGLLSHEFVDGLVELLEAWSRRSGGFTPVLPDSRYFNEVSFFQRAIQKPASLDYTSLVQFAAFVLYLRHHAGDLESDNFQDWMRVVRNLATNTDIERSQEFARSLAGLKALLPHSASILRHLAEAEIGQIGFSPQQMREEMVKARLLLADPAWSTRIERAEGHGYFLGQIDFLLDFCGVIKQSEQNPENWDQRSHQELQVAFDQYYSKAQLTFSSSGLSDATSQRERHLWRRALLVMGDYLLSNGDNYSFLTDPKGNWDSWKNFLRRRKGGKRLYLKNLWDRINLGSAVEPQLEAIIASSTALEPWRIAIINHHEVIEYCETQEIRRVENSEEIYLLKKRQMNGYHAELFSYALYLDLREPIAARALTPLRVLPYESVRLTDREPRVVLRFSWTGQPVTLFVESIDGAFLVSTSDAEIVNLPQLVAILCDEAGFEKSESELVQSASRDDIQQSLNRIAGVLRKHSNVM